MPTPRTAMMAGVLVLGTLPAGGCFHHGARIAHRIDDPPRGAVVHLGMPDDVAEAAGIAWLDQLEGELLMVRDTLLLLGQPDRYLAIPVSLINAAWIGPGQGPWFGSDGGPPTATEMRPYARHPHGLSNDQVGALMRASGVDSLVLLRSGARQPVPWLPDSLPADDPPAARPAAAHGPGHQPDAASAAFLDSLRLAGARFRRVEEAIAAGYRKVGPAFPGMGEHWIHPGRVVSGRVDPSAPAVLAYVMIGGERRLIAAAFTLPLAPGESPPHHPAGAEVWHDHAGRVDEELLLLAHPATHLGEGERPRLAMFHAWLWLENPAGVFAQNNWTLPFAQTGLPLERAPSSNAARALSLVTAGPDYYLALFEAADPQLGRDAARLRRILERHARAAESWREGWRGPVDRTGLVQLEDLWLALWQDVRDAVADRTWERIAPLAGEGARTSVVRRLRLRDTRVFGTIAAPMYYVDDAPATFTLGLSVPLTATVGLRAQVEQSDAPALGLVCYSRCYSTGEGRLRFWTIGLDMLLREIPGGHGALIGGAGLGKVSSRIEDDSGAGASAVHLSLRADVRVLSFASVQLEAATYVAELDHAAGTGTLFPSLRVGLAVGRPGR